MSEKQDSNDKIVEELKKIGKRLDNIHGWIIAFIIITVLFYFLLMRYLIVGYI